MLMFSCHNLFGRPPRALAPAGITAIAAANRDLREIYPPADPFFAMEPAGVSSP